MSHESSLPRSSQHEVGKKKRKLSPKQKLMGVGATVATGVALFGAGTMVGGSSEKVNSQQGLEKVDLSKDQQGPARFEQILDPNEQHRLVSEGVDAPTPEAALDKLFNAMGHDYRILDVYAKLSGAYLGYGYDTEDTSAFNDPDLQASLLSDDAKSLSHGSRLEGENLGEEILGLVKNNLTEGVSGHPEDVTVQFVDLKDEISDGTSLYMTGMGKNGLVRNAQPNVFGDDTKAVEVTFPAPINMPNQQEGFSSIIFTVSGGQPVLKYASNLESIPVGHTEADGHEPTVPSYEGE